MGLDMYLRAEKYIGNYNHSNADEKAAAKAVAEAVGISPFMGESITVKMRVGYWRKANAIHRWFVEKVQGGEDECKEFSVSREQLQELVDQCKAVINGAPAESSLPTQSGFFFGSTGYDEDYRADLRNTIRQVEPLLTDPKWKGFEFSYQSSW